MSKSGKQVGLKDLAEELGLTISTVSRALNNNPRISDATRERVQALARKRNYRQNMAAASLRTGKSKTLGVIIPLVNRTFFASVISSIENVVNQSGYRVIICQTNESGQKEKEAVDALLKATVDGVAVSLSAGTHDFSHFEAIRQAGISLILFDRTSDEIGAHQVLVDDRLGAKTATKHLIEGGCKRILHIGGPQHIGIYKNRTAGYLDALKEANLEQVDELLVFTDVREKSARELITTYLKQGVCFDGIMASSDFAAVGAMQVLQESGKQIPDEVAIVGFANEPFTNWVTPGLSSVSQHTEEMGETVAELFLTLEDKKKRRSVSARKIVLEPELIIRASSKR